MRRRLEAALPLLVLVGFALVGIVVNLLLTNAQDQGVQALEDSIIGQVDAIAATQDKTLEDSFENAEDFLFGGEIEPFELTVGSESDREALEGLLGPVITPQLPSGFYLVNAEGVVTQGFLLTDESVVGKPFEWPGFDELAVQLDSPDFPGGVLPVMEGLTTGQPSLGNAFRIQSASGELGMFVFESIVEPGSTLNEEFSALGRGETDRYMFFDDQGTVIASNDASLIAESVEESFLTEPEGLHRFGGEVVVISELDFAPWRVAFRQDVDEFEGGLARPLESLGRILVIALLVAGFVLTVMLYRRLRAARAEQERLRQLSEAQQELISIVSHELRTPVAGVLGFLETTLDHWDGMDDADRHRAVSRAATNARRLQAMTRDVLDTQSVEAGRLVHVMEPLDLTDEVRTAVEAAKELDPEREFEVRVPTDAVWVSGDADRIQQVLANLLDNARKSSPAIEPIEVEVTVEDGHAQVAVIDHGAGIEPESLDRIFEKFVRGRDEGVTGTGLGLYISRQILDAHGGAIWAESDGGGATFRFRLPVQAPAEAAPVD